MVNILRNTKRKCGAKGIFWLACPTAATNGKPVGQLWVSVPCLTPWILLSHSHCVGTTSNSEDFKSFLGPERAKELKGYFSNWIHQIYCESPNLGCSCSHWPMSHISTTWMAPVHPGQALQDNHDNNAPVRALLPTHHYYTYTTLAKGKRDCSCITASLTQRSHDILGPWAVVDPVFAGEARMSK